MPHIGIVGSGIAGLQLALFLQQHGVLATLYSDRTPDQIRAGRLPNSVARFAPTRARERALGVDHWDFPDYGMFCVHFRINGDPPLTFLGNLSEPGSFIDMRIYQAVLTEDFLARGGEVVVGAVQADDLAQLAPRHDLLVIASGRASLTDLFPRIPEYSPYTEPQRHLCSALFRGVAPTEPLGVSFNISPGHGEIFQAPFYSFDGPCTSILFEGIPGGGIAPLMQLRYDDDPRQFEATVLDVLRDHAPAVYERVDHAAFGLTGPLDLLQGAITPVVRRGYTRLDDGSFVIALGDVHVLNDPILGQGANAASREAWLLGEAILAGGPYDEEFCQQVEQRTWDAVRPVTEWTNMALLPPPHHALDVFIAASQNQEIADQVIDNFGAPERNWQIFGSPDGASAFLRQYAEPVQPRA